jgi:hypothetical protein
VATGNGMSIRNRFQLGGLQGAHIYRMRITEKKNFGPQQSLSDRQDPGRVTTVN